MRLRRSYLFKFLFLLLSIFCCISIVNVATAAPLAPEAQQRLSFNPTAGDVSVVFLGNIFGVVDGVLAGSGSQIIGNMFGVFNSAVLAFGGIILLYSLVISTTSTAHEGQMLGQKWSSIWLPLRSFVGVGTILPLTSGYCVMQVFVMWLVLQGVGAADSVWSATLSYLNRGGVIVQKQLSASTSATADNGKVLDAAMGILIAQTCMNALEIKYRDLYEAATKDPNPTSNCEVNSNWSQFCNTSVPIFIDSVNITSDDNTTQMLDGNSITQLMPNFTDGSIYEQLNGICGKLSWDTYSPTNTDDTLTHSEQLAVQNSRSVAVLQMYNALIPVAAAMIDNSPFFNPSIICNPAEATCVSNSAKYAFGMPLTSSYGSGCSPTAAYSDENACVNWAGAKQQPAIFNGTELLDAVAAYNGVMLPTLSVDALNARGGRGKPIYDPATATYYHRDQGPKAQYARQRAFIKEAQSRGWLMAGAYFFRLALLNNYMNQALGSSGSLTDTNSNLKFAAGAGTTSGDWTYSSVTDLLEKISPAHPSQCPTSSPAFEEPFCSLSSLTFSQIGAFLAGTVATPGLAIPTSSKNISTETAAWYNPSTNNVYTYLVNANSMVLPSQVTVLNAGLNESAASSFNPKSKVPHMGGRSIGGGKWGLPGAAINIFWNKAIIPLKHMFDTLMVRLTHQLLSLVLTPMISMISTVFYKALNVMRMEGVNPIVSIAIMGTQLIDGMGNAWIGMLMYASLQAVTILGLAVMIALMPLVVTWMGIMLAAGFTAAFYVPFVPFLIFSFAGIGWLISVIESMIAAPIVALGVIIPDGHDVFGKSEEAIMLLLNVFLRPSLMILGYIFGIILSYVGVWILNEGFNYVMQDFKLLPVISSGNYGGNLASRPSRAHYGFWSSIFVLYFGVLVYVSSYMAIVQHAFELIHHLPDKVLRWLSGSAVEQFGEATVQSMLAEVKQQSDTASKAAVAAMSKVSANMSEYKERDDDDDDDDDSDESKADEGEQEKASKKDDKPAKEGDESVSGGAETTGGETAVEATSLEQIHGSSTQVDGGPLSEPTPDPAAGPK